MTKQVLIDEDKLKMVWAALKSYQGFIDDAHIIEGQWHWLNGTKEAIKALEEALAKQEQGEPAMTVRVWRDKHGDQTAEFRNWHTLSDGEHSLYTTPQQRTWVELTEEDFVCVHQLCNTPIQAAEYVNHLLKEKNNA